MRLHCKHQQGFLERAPVLVVMVVLSLAYVLLKFIETPAIWSGGLSEGLKFTGI